MYISPAALFVITIYMDVEPQKILSGAGNQSGDFFGEEGNDRKGPWGSVCGTRIFYMWC